MLSALLLAENGAAIKWIRNSEVAYDVVVGVDNGALLSNFCIADHRAIIPSPLEPPFRREVA